MRSNGLRQRERREKARRVVRSEQVTAIPSARGLVPGLLADAPNAIGAAIMCGGAGGGTLGPSGVYADLAERLPAVGITALRLDYRNPNVLRECVADVIAGIASMERRGVRHVVLIGWSFGGAVVIAAGAESAAVVGVATVASQTFGTQAVSELAPHRRLLLIHGTHDQVLSDLCSRQLYERAGEPKDLVLFQGDGHGIEQHRAEMLERLYTLCTDLLLPNQEDAASMRPEERHAQSRRVRGQGGDDAQHQ